MKTILRAIFVLSLVLSTLSSYAQTVTYIGSSSGDQMPGSPTDYIFFNSADYSNGNVVGQGPQDLTSFSMVGGVAPFSVGTTIGSYTLNDTSSIIVPGGTSPVATGALASGGGTIAFQLKQGTVASGVNSNFNYNDFDVFIMIGNVDDEWSDTTVNLTPYYPNDPSNPEDSTSAWGTNAVTVTPDNNTNLNSATYLEFQVTGLGSAAGSTDLALTVNYPTSVGTAYVSGVSFESVPEPKIWAMLLGGVGILVVMRQPRRKGYLA